MPVLVGELALGFWQLAEGGLLRIDDAGLVLHERGELHLVLAELVERPVAVGRRDLARGDGGVDGVINQDILGLDRVYVQAKRWKDSVGVDRIYAFAGSLEAKKATKGVIITSSTFTEGARKATEALAKRVVLIDGAELTRHMMTFGLGVRVVNAFSILAPDADAFDSFEV